MSSVTELLATLTDPATRIERAATSVPMRDLVQLLRTGDVSTDESVEVLNALAGSLRVETEPYSCPASRLILEAVAANPVPACAVALAAVADRLPVSARAQTLRSLLRIAVRSEHETAVVDAMRLLGLWTDEIQLGRAGGIFYFLERNPMSPEIVLPALAAIETDNTRLCRSIEELRQRYRRKGLIPKDMDFPSIYTRAYLQKLAEKDPHELAQVVIGGVSARTAEAASTFDVVSGLPEVVRNAYVAWWVEAEVQNGGLAQYFWNWSGDFAVAAVAALDAIGLPEIAELLRRGIVAQADAESDWRPLRQIGTLEAFSASYDLDALGDTGSDVARVMRDEPISTALIGYLGNHLDDLAAFFVDS